jgi:hypothetical protein
LQIAQHAFERADRAQALFGVIAVPPQMIAE